MSHDLSIETVAEFLRAHPRFFEDHPDVLLNIEVPHPHGGRTVSIPERQLIATRDKVRLLEAKLAELVQYGEENDRIGRKVHQLALKLTAAATYSQAIETLYLDLLETFEVPHVAIRFWAGMPADAAVPECQPVAPELHEFVQAMEEPYVGAHAVYETHRWFGEHAAHLKSFALVPLKSGTLAGVMLLASENAERFYAGMGTLFLARIGDLVAACVARHVGGGTLGG